MNFNDILSRPPEASEAREKVRTLIYPSSQAACAFLAAEVKRLVLEKEAAGQKLVLGLATGSSPVPFYRELIRLHKEENLSFRNVITFNLDEYGGLGPTHPESYRRFMQDQLFDHVDIDPANSNVPDGMVAPDEVFESCAAYEKKIRDAGGIDLQILGIGRTGHIGFNEPGSTKDSLTRRITLDRVTREDAASDFLGVENVPRFAITMGVGTILRAKRIVLMAWGGNKAEITARAVEGPVSEAVSASFLQEHEGAVFLLDEPAAAELTRRKRPWLVMPVKWETAATMKAACWLAATMKKPVLKLVDEDYNEHGMADLLTQRGSAYEINIEIFNRLQHSITGWPGGKPGADDTHRPERAAPHPKVCLVLSPEPQDAISAIGGTIRRLIHQGHEVWFCAMTSASLRVADAVPERFARGVLEIASAHGAEWDNQAEYARDILAQLKAKGAFGEDSHGIRQLKGMLLRGEVQDALAILGLPKERIRFLNLPFYEKGRYRRFKSGVEDIATLFEMFQEIKPHQIFLTGDAADPSSVQSLCYRVSNEAMRRAAVTSSSWIRDCRTWIYRSKETPYEAHEVEMAVPMSPDQVAEKVHALRCLQEVNEFERHAAERNRAMAAIYDNLGLAEYEAIESFRRGST